MDQRFSGKTQQSQDIDARILNSSQQRSFRSDKDEFTQPKTVRSWRQRFRRQDPEAQLKTADTSGSSGTADSNFTNGFSSGLTAHLDVKRLYDEFQEDFEKELLNRKIADGWTDSKLNFLTDKYLGQKYPVGDTSDSTFDADGYITYFKRSTQQSTQQILEQKLPIKGMTQTTDSFMEMETAWIRHQNEQGTSLTEEPDIRWIHLPANNMMWVQQVMLNILEFNHKSAPGDTVSGTRAREVRDNILQRDYWQHRSNRSLEGKIWGRYMQPFSRCIKPIPGEGDISPALNTPTIAVYMPYLHWERNAAAAYVRNVAQDVYENYPINYRFEPDTATNLIAQMSRYGASTDEKLLRRYLRCRQHLHIRHTLDQYFHPYLRDYSDRDFDQVVERYSRRYGLEDCEEYKNESPLLMVDQLWLWVIGGDTVLTCFPTTWGYEDGLDDPLDVRSKIMYNLQKPLNHPCYSSATHLANIILNQCAANMLEPSLLVHERHKFLNFFQQSITVLMEKQTRSLKKLLCMSTPERLSAHDKLLDTTEEFSMLTEGRDIEEELKIIRVVIERQEDALRQLQRALFKYQTATSSQDVHSVEKVMMGLQIRKKAIDGMSKAIKGVNEQILQLLGLKQQQASISEARTSRMLAQQGETQSASMMLFTVVTILFLPLSTMTSFFGVNSQEFGSGSLSLGHVSAYIFPISAACVGISFFLGFNHQARRTLLMWLDYIAESITGPDRNHFWAAREAQIQTRLKRKRKEKRAALARIRRRRHELQAPDANGSSEEDEQPDIRINAYRSRLSLRSSISSEYGLDDNLVESRQLRPRAGSHSSSHIYTSGPDTEEEASDRPISPESRLSPSRSARPSGASGTRPAFSSGLVHTSENEAAILDDHQNAIPSFSVQGPEATAPQPIYTPSSPALAQHSRSSSGSRGLSLHEATLKRAANQASQQQQQQQQQRQQQQQQQQHQQQQQDEVRPRPTSGRRSLPEIEHIHISSDSVFDLPSDNDRGSGGRRESEPSPEHHFDGADQ